jgi:hypothetical protein
MLSRIQEAYYLSMSLCPSSKSQQRDESQKQAFVQSE